MDSANRRVTDISSRGLIPDPALAGLPLADLPLADLVALGRDRRAAGDLRGALDAFEAALARCGQDPDACPDILPDILFETAGLLRALEMHDDALALYDALAALMPDAVPVLHNRANCLADLGRGAEALAGFRAVLARHDDAAPSWAGLGEAAFATGQTGLGTAACHRAIALAPGRTASYVNFAEACAAHADDALAVRLLGRAAALAPGDPAIGYNLARSQLPLGDYAGGWARYEARLDPEMRNFVHRAIACPRWDGGPLAGRHLFVCGEQGLGDQIWLLPFVRQAAGLAGRVTLEVAPKLVDLVRHSLAGVEVWPLRAERRAGRWHASGDSRTGPAGADLYIEAGSLPLYLWERHWEGQRAGDRPAAGPSLRPDPALVARWRQRLEAVGPGEVKIGLCWRSPLVTRGRGQDYLPVTAWRPILDVLMAARLRTAGAGGRSLCAVCLQHGDIGDDLAWIRRTVGLEVQVLPGLDLWDGLHDTAALMASLDLTVTAWTSIALIGGGLGVPTLVVGNSRWVAPAGGLDPVHPAIEPVYPIAGPPPSGRPWPVGVVDEVARRLAARLGSSGRPQGGDFAGTGRNCPPRFAPLP
jgi:Flp pilus assembly protein TadD